MPNMLILGEGGAIDSDRVVAVAPFRSKPIQRMLNASEPGKVLNLTYGYPRLSVILLENGYLIISHRTVGELTRAVHTGEALNNGSNRLPWWD